MEHGVDREEHEGVRVGRIAERNAYEVLEDVVIASPEHDDSLINVNEAHREHIPLDLVQGLALLEPMITQHEKGRN